ncbi:LysR family transcriptional regulator [Stenotrophomonas maltophilia]|nr:LysR family transcriptional regulator [Stenotrophomonas maltophilia]MDZ5777232.1 LysR family transcriptional regulator [Stenotrophomonas maltophilia]
MFGPNSQPAAALELGLSASALSHALKRLEDRLGVRLVNRTTRALSITVEGRELERYAATGLDTIGEGLAAIRARKQSEIQMLKISLSHDAARLLLWPVLWSFQQRWPNVHLDLVIEERLVDLVAEGFDGGIRYGDRVPEGWLVWSLHIRLSGWSWQRPAICNMLGDLRIQAICGGMFVLRTESATAQSIAGNLATVIVWSR